jgi:pimeloyl-ACP methyl ester carboxylesterase
MKSCAIVAFSFIIPLLAVAGSKTSSWEGYQRLDFEVDGRSCLLVVPKSPAKGNPWIWRMEFFGREPQGDLALLALGYHVAYMDVQNMYGAPEALGHMDNFYDYLVVEYNLSPKVFLEGFTSGGLFAFNWAARHPEQVAGLYVNTPVCDFKSWPAGKGKGEGSATDWERCKEIYGLSEQQAMTYAFNPVDNLQPLANAKIPILSICSDADPVVPLAENTAIVEKRYRQLGGPIKVITKPGDGRHPHIPPDPTPIVKFVTMNTPQN